VIARLAAAPRDGARLPAWLSALPVDRDDVAGLLVADPSHPYGRGVLFSDAGLEVMLATWTPGATCAPHDHGGAEGAVRIVAGRCIHRVYAPRGDALVLVDEREHGPGDVLVADRDLVHGMQDISVGEPLVTLHVYVPGIRDMVVYDVPGRRTLVVDGGCGAWVPDDPKDVIRAIDGFVLPPSR
jgi:predicted metal-dependent enzyme (double-stranded beta helix superfamily)